MELSQWLAAERGRTMALASHLGIAAPMVSNIAAGRKQVPLDRCPAIQEFTGGAVTCEELRPDMVEFFAMVRQQAGSREAKQPPALANAAKTRRSPRHELHPGD